MSGSEDRWESSRVDLVYCCACEDSLVVPGAKMRLEGADEEGAV